MRNSYLRLGSLCGLILVLGSPGAWPGDWRQFRGNDATGVIAAKDLSKAISLDVTWQAPLVGRGLSSPIVVGDKVFVSSASGYRQDRLHVACFEASTGRPV